MGDPLEAVSPRADEPQARTHESATRAAIAERVARVVPASVRHVVRYAVEHGDRPRSVTQLAAAVGIPRKSLDRRLAENTRVTARALLTWGRLIAVAMRLADPTVNGSRVARDLRFASPSAMRNLLQRYAKLTPTELRRAGGTEPLVAMLVAKVRPSS